MSSRVYKTKPILPAFDRLTKRTQFVGDVVDNLVEGTYSTLAPRCRSASICNRVPPPNRAR
jgi:hypothetical protein